MKRQLTKWTTLLALTALVAAPAALADRDDKGPTIYTTGSGQGVYAIGSGDGDGYAYGFTTAGNRAYLGVTLEEETDWGEGGARITRVVDDSPADKAGLQKGDIIVGFDGDTIRGPMGLTRAIHDTEPGDAVVLTIVRDGREQKLELEMGERKGVTVLSPEWNREFGERMGELGQRLGQVFSCEEGDCEWVGPDCEGDDCPQALTWSFGNFNRPTLGVQLVEVTPELREHLGSSREAGVLVSKVLDGTPADQSGIRVGDLIVNVAGDDIGNTGDLRRALRDKRGETFDVGVLRDGRSVTIEVTIPEPERDRPTGPRAWTVPERDAREAYSVAVGMARDAQRQGRIAQRDATRAYQRALRDAERARRAEVRDIRDSI